MDPVITSTWSAALLALLTAGVFLYRYGAAPPMLLLAAGLVLLAAECVFVGASAAALLPEHMLTWQRARLAVAAFVPGCWLAFSLVYARANHREFYRLWRWPLVAVCVLPVLLVAGGWAHLAVDVQIDDGRLYWTHQIGAAGYALRVLEILAAVLILMNAEKTLREARGTTRWRVKFLLAGVLIIFAARIVVWGQALWLKSIDPVHDALGALTLVAGCGLLLFSIRRSPRWQVELYVSTDMLFGSITVMVVAAYLMGVGLLAHITVHGAGDTLALFLAVSAVAALVFLLLLMLSDRARVAARRFLVRHLRRPLFDYRQIWRVFSGRTLHALNAPDVAREVCRLVSETFEALSVSLWLVDERSRLRLAASTALAGGAHALHVPEAIPPEILKSWRHADGPMDLDRAGGDWATWLRTCNPIQFPEGGHRFCMPLISEHGVLGIMILGDRVRGIPFSAEELDLIRILADQTAARMFTVRMSERLMHVKQMEAFQLMSAFLVHDLKNTAYGLSLTLHNLRSHFGDPGFRRDAERTLADGVNRINSIIERLGRLRQNIELKPRAVDINAWLQELLQSLKGMTNGSVVWRPGPPLHLQLDPDQMLTVLTNLVINAREASPPGQPVEIRTSSGNGWAELTVTDSGCGMDSEFIASRLFHPFETTKKSGMGIGLYQSRMVVEAHGGRIEVESEPDCGSTFRVLLPLENVA